MKRKNGPPGSQAYVCMRNSISLLDNVAKGGFSQQPPPKPEYTADTTVLTTEILLYL